MRNKNTLQIITLEKKAAQLFDKIWNEPIKFELRMAKMEAEYKKIISKIEKLRTE